MSVSTSHLLKPQKRVFTRKKRNYGFFSVFFSVLSVLALMPVYSSYAGELISFSWLMVALAICFSIIFPLILTSFSRDKGPRFFLLINSLMLILFLVLLGGFTDRRLESHGETPFRAFASLVGADENSGIIRFGEEYTDFIRYITISGKISPEEEEEEAEDIPEEELPKFRADLSSLPAMTFFSVFLDTFENK